MNSSSFRMLAASRRAALVTAVSRALSSVTSPQQPQALSVFISQSNNVFTNLALEHWLYKNFQFGRHNVLLLWRNAPCVVIGRHQNPWREVNADLLRSATLPLARRNSGGGAVYHDLGNLNLTFFTDRQQYCRRDNLELVAKTLRHDWGLDVLVNGRDDLLLDQSYKISGTAAKLTKNVAYHHCTLLVDVDTERLQDALQNPVPGLESRATESVPAAVRNLSQSDPSVTMDRVIAAVGQRYLGQAGRQANRGFQMINPTDEWFPGLSEMERTLRHPDWVYSKTPKFHHTFTLPTCSGITVRVEVNQGRVTSIEPVRPDNNQMTAAEWVRSILPSASPELLDTLVGHVYSGDLVRRAEQALLGTPAPAPAGPTSDKRLLAM